MTLSAGSPTRRPSDVLLALVGVRVFLWLSVVASAFPGLFTDPRKLATYHDEHFWYAHEDASRIATVQYHQLHQWNPFYCGGVPGIANPQDSTWAPETIFKLLLGVGPGRRLVYVLLFVLGMEGFYRLARRHDASVIGAAIAAIIFGCCSFFLDMVRLGWQSFFSFQLLPWVVLAFYEGLRSRVWRVVGGVFVAWMVLQGGLYAVPYTVLVLAILTAATTTTLLVRRRPSSIALSAPMMAFVTIGVVSVFVSAAKLFPTMIVVRSLPRIWQASEAMPWTDILSRLLKFGVYDGQPAYIGGYVAGMAIVAAGFDRRAAGFLALAAVFLLFSLGDFAAFAPASILRKLPVFEQLRFPHRMVILVAFFACLAFSRAITRIEDAVIIAGRALHARLVAPSAAPLPWVGVAFVGVIGAFAAFQLARVVHADFFEDTRIEASLFPMDAPLDYAQPFRQSRGNRWDAQVWAPASRGSLQCFEETAFFQSGKLRGDLPAEEYPLDPSTAKVTRIDWTPNVIKLRVEASAPATVVINQNFAKGFRANVGSTRSHEGLLAIDVPPGNHDLVVRYRDPWVYIGLATSVASVVALIALGIRRVRLSAAAAPAESS